VTQPLPAAPGASARAPVGPRAAAHPSAAPARRSPRSRAGHVQLTFAQQAIAHDCSYRALRGWTKSDGYKRLSACERLGARRAIAWLVEQRRICLERLPEACNEMDRLRRAEGL